MSNKAQNKAIQIYQTILSQLPKPDMIVFNDPHTTDQYKFGVVKLDDNFYYDGVVRGNRPDGIGIMVEKKQIFSVRGRFANTKLCGAGRVELESGEIYDGVFRNGIFCSGICYHAKEDRFIYGNFKTPEIKILVKGKGYPYQLFLNNKEKLYDSTLIYKTTCSEIVFAPQEDRHLVREFDRFKYNFDLMSHQSSYQDSIFQTSYKEHNFSQISEEMGTADQYYNVNEIGEYNNNQMNINDIQVIDSETNQLIEQMKQNYHRQSDNSDGEDDYQGQEENIIMTADFSHHDNKSYQEMPQTIDSIARQRDQRMKQMEESTNKSNILIESLKNKLETYDKIKKSMKEQQQRQVSQNDYSSQHLNINTSHQSNAFNSNQISEINNINNISSDLGYQYESKRIGYQYNQNNEIQVNRMPNDWQKNSVNSNKIHQQFTNNINNNNNIKNQFQQYNPHSKDKDQTKQIVQNLGIATNQFENDGKYVYQDYENNQSVKESSNSQQSFATFSNQKNGMEMFYQDNDENEIFKQQDKPVEKYINIQINQSTGLKQDVVSNNRQEIQPPIIINNNNPKIVVNDLSTQSANLSPNNQYNDNDLLGNFSTPSLQYQSYNLEKNQELDDFKISKDDNHQYHYQEENNSIKDRLQKQLTDQEIKKKTQSQSIDFQRSIGNWDEESKEEERNRQKSQFSVDFDINHIVNNKSNEQEVIENYFNNLRAQLTDKNISNSTGTISALNEILSDQNYHSKGKNEDMSLMQILEERAGQGVRSLSIEKHAGVQRKFLDSSIQYLESEQNINAKDSQNNSGFTHSFDRSDRKTIDKQNPSQFYRYTQNSLSERNDEDDEDSSSFNQGSQIGQQKKGIDSVIEDNQFQCSFNDRSSSENDKAFINSNLNLTQ